MKRKILFVCLGNICRSPLAEAIFSHLVAEAGLNHLFEADSCGTSAEHRGAPPDERTLRNAAGNGIFFKHQARKLSPDDFENQDLILTMDIHNHRETTGLARRLGYNKADIRMMRSFDPMAEIATASVPDPWYGDDHDFEEVFRILHRSCRGLLSSLQEQVFTDE